ncbi:MAG: hydrogenase expression/formation protein HypE [Calditerrivibrio sp.]|nr:hydrogenase expression/formation protein HypE [Calditerrivibrio sp.]
MDDYVTLAVGGGGRSFQSFLKVFIKKNLSNEILDSYGDASYLNLNGDIAISTDSYVIEPEFFNGGDIGKLSIFGTCNDLTVSGAIPEYITLSLIISEGYSYKKLDEIFLSIKAASCQARVKVVCGDTKVIPSEGKQFIFINTTGIGRVIKKLNDYNNIKIGDKVIFSSDLARHGISIMMSREGIEHDLMSDCCLLYSIFERLDYTKISFARDATRGGVAAVLNEIALMSGLGIEIFEENMIIDDRVRYYCEFFGYDPLHIANEGLSVILVREDYAMEALEIIKNIDIGKNASIVGEVVGKNKVILNTSIGGRRYVEMPLGEILPRIC